MLIKSFFILIILFTFQTGSNSPTGKFFHSNGYEHYKLTLNKDNSFEQFYGNCMEQSFALGKWTKKNDTIILLATSVYEGKYGKRKKTREDTSSYFYKQFFKLHNKLLILSNDTLKHLRLASKSKRPYKLVRQHK